MNWRKCWQHFRVSLQWAVQYVRWWFTTFSKAPQVHRPNAPFQLTQDLVDLMRDPFGMSEGALNINKWCSYLNDSGSASASMAVCLTQLLLSSAVSEDELSSQMLTNHRSSILVSINCNN
eukprot:GHVN01001599.1.p1 GENE.GHVN01001599.1~~GHVN01001599.1.p1  ORF type:complete len:120 (-),score=7.73 GHVN01001599.1:649-1008(-)